MKLNAQQQAVIAHGPTPLLVIAGAGTGKTTVMTHRVAALVAQGTHANRLLLLTFTRKAAEELRRRAAARLGLEPAALRWCGTFHSVAARLLRHHGQAIGVAPSFSILDQTDAGELLDLVAKECVKDRTKDNFLSKAQLLRLHSFQANTQRPLEEVVAELAPKLQRDRLELLEQCFARYAQRKRDAQALDYDDLLLDWLELLRHPQAGPELGQLFDGIMVDEYQDTNVIQSQILSELCRHTRNITVVGDDAQAIYAFRGATVANILGFETQFPTVIRLNLEENYRSTQEILDAANALWQEAEEGYRKELVAAAGPGRPPRLLLCRDEQEQADRVVGHVLESWHRDRVPLRDMAVLFRSSHHSFLLETALKKYRIPFKKFGGQRFMDAAHIKDALCFLRVCENPKDEPAWRRLLCLLPGIGPAAAGKCLAPLTAGGEPAPHFQRCKLPAKAEPYRAELVKLFTELTQPDWSPEDQLGLVLDFYLPLLPFHYDYPETREKELEQLPIMARQFDNRRELLDELLTGDDSLVENPAREPDEFLTLSTIHSAKGLEWRRVHLLHLVEGGLPAGPSLEDGMKAEEERRLLYVAMTRAKEELILCVPELRYAKDRGHQPCRPSRFLSPNVLKALHGGERLLARRSAVVTHPRDDHWPPTARTTPSGRPAAARPPLAEGELVYDYDDDDHPGLFRKPPGPRRHPADELDDPA